MLSASSAMKKRRLMDIVPGTTAEREARALNGSLLQAADIAKAANAGRASKPAPNPFRQTTFSQSDVKRVYDAFRRRFHELAPARLSDRVRTIVENLPVLDLLVLQALAQERRAAHPHKLCSWKEKILSTPMKYDNPATVVTNDVTLASLFDYMLFHPNNPVTPNPRPRFNEHVAQSDWMLLLYFKMCDDADPTSPCVYPTLIHDDIAARNIAYGMELNPDGELIRKMRPQYTGPCGIDFDLDELKDKKDTLYSDGRRVPGACYWQLSLELPGAKSGAEPDTCEDQIKRWVMGQLTSSSVERKDGEHYPVMWLEPGYTPSINGYIIRDIWAIWNTKSTLTFNEAKNEFARHHGPDAASVVVTYHGTSTVALKSIMTTGFAAGGQNDRDGRPVNVAIGSRFGKVLYTSRNLMDCEGFAAQRVRKDKEEGMHDSQPVIIAVLMVVGRYAESNQKTSAVDSYTPSGDTRISWLLGGPCQTLPFLAWQFERLDA